MSLYAYFIQTNQVFNDISKKQNKTKEIARLKLEYFEMKKIHFLHVKINTEQAILTKKYFYIL